MQVVHYLRQPFHGCEEIASKPLGALYSTDNERVHRAESGFFFSLDTGAVTCSRCLAIAGRSSMIRDEFKVHILNEVGVEKAEEIAKAYSDLLNKIEALIPTTADNARELAIMKTDLQRSAFHAKRAMALHPAHQK